ncbi:MAG: hypothetical protein K2Q24_12585 [Chitinophagaceae bacterium]|jgi:hypothetical protein|nr:hypothetical protein [Chitinophagaceae bacterium]
MKQLHSLFIFVLLLPCLINAQQQLNTGIVKAKVFYQYRSQGTQMVDEKGEPLQQAATKIHFVVLEVKGTQSPVVDSLFYFGHYYPCTVSGISNPKWNIGTVKRTGKTAAWKLQPGSSLWMIEFNPTLKPMKYKPAARIKGKTGRKKFVTTVSAEAELETEQAQ